MVQVVNLKFDLSLFFFFIKIDLEILFADVLHRKKGFTD